MTPETAWVVAGCGFAFLAIFLLAFQGRQIFTKGRLLSHAVWAALKRNPGPFVLGGFLLGLVLGLLLAHWFWPPPAPSCLSALPRGHP